FFSSRRRHTRFSRDWSSDVCSSDLDFDDIISKKHALKILNVDKSVYTENDIKALKILKDGNLLTYFPEAEIVESRGIFGVTRKRSEERRVGKEWRERW